MDDGRGERRFRIGVGVLILLGGCGICDGTAAAEAYSLAEPATDARVKSVQLQVAIGGKILTVAGPGKNASHESHEIDASAEYRFRERRLTGAGRDAAAYRCLREFDRASMRTTISGQVTQHSLPAELAVIAVHGRPSGMLTYSPDELLRGADVDLLNVPGDPLAMIALLPVREVEVGEDWDVPEWAVQMLATLEAVGTATMTARLAEITDRIARVEFEGRAEGAREGAVTNVNLSGELHFDLDQNMITFVELTHAEQSAIGSVRPGLDSKVRVTTRRSLATSDGALTAERATAIPLEPPADRLPLRFEAQPWGLQLVHGRGWQLFLANYDAEPEVVILRLLEDGEVVCQCNFSPIPPAPPGKHVPLEEYEASIQQSLGDRLGAIVARDEIPTSDGRRIFRVTTRGTYEITDKEGTKEVPIHWIYYLCADPSGRQVSFLFSIESAMMERLAGEDRQIVESLQFTRPAS
jgi:hypothetical protein